MFFKILLLFLFLSMRSVENENNDQSNANHSCTPQFMVLCRMFKHCERTEEGLQSKTMTATALEETFDTLD